MIIEIEFRWAPFVTTRRFSFATNKQVGAFTIIRYFSDGSPDVFITRTDRIIALRRWPISST